MGDFNKQEIDEIVQLFLKVFEIEIYRKVNEKDFKNRFFSFCNAANWDNKIIFSYVYKKRHKLIKKLSTKTIYSTPLKGETKFKIQIHDFLHKIAKPDLYEIFNPDNNEFLLELENEYLLKKEIGITLAEYFYKDGAVYDYLQDVKNGRSKKDATKKILKYLKGVRFVDDYFFLYEMVDLVNSYSYELFRVCQLDFFLKLNYKNIEDFKALQIEKSNFFYINDTSTEDLYKNKKIPFQDLIYKDVTAMAEGNPYAKLDIIFSKLAEKYKKSKSAIKGAYYRGLYSFRK